MKKTLFTILMSMVMILSIFTNSYAFTPQQKTDIVDALNVAGVGAVHNVEVPADIELKRSVDADFADGPFACTYYDEPVLVDYKAMLDMETVKATFRTYTNVVDTLFEVNYPESADLLKAEFAAMPVRAEFVVTVTVPSGMVVPAEFLSTPFKGFSAQVSHFFNETSRTMSGNVVTITFELKDPNSDNEYITKQQLSDGLEDYLSDFTLTCEGLSVNAVGTYVVVGDVTGSVYVGGTNKNNAPYVINFDAEQMTGAHDTENGLLQGTLIVQERKIVDNRPGSVSPVKPEDSGKIVAYIGDEVSEYKPGKDGLFDVTSITVPEVKGKQFEGWYYDELFTKPVEDLIKVENGETVYIYAKFVNATIPDKFEASDEHFAYIIGYPDGTVRPEDNISREEIATIFYRLMTDEYRAEIASATNDFTDVEADRWSNKAISTMANGGYIQGYNGEFKPEDAITRAEFVTIAARFLETDNEAKADFTDIEGHWAKEYIDATSDALWINGYEDGTFRPDNFITRAESMAIFNRILCRRVNSDGLIEGTVYFPDVADTDWFVYEVLEATNSHKCERADAEVYENWTELLPNRDWTKY